MSIEEDLVEAHWPVIDGGGDGESEPFSESWDCSCGAALMSWVQSDPACSNRPAWEEWMHAYGVHVAAHARADERRRVSARILELHPPTTGDDGNQVCATCVSLGAHQDYPCSTLLILTAGSAPVATSEPRRYDQCDGTCTVDCGHCKGQGRPVATPTGEARRLADVIAAALCAQEESADDGEAWWGQGTDFVASLAASAVAAARSSAAGSASVPVATPGPPFDADELLSDFAAELGVTIPDSDWGDALVGKYRSDIERAVAAGPLATPTELAGIAALFQRYVAARGLVFTIPYPSGRKLAEEGIEYAIEVAAGNLLAARLELGDVVLAAARQAELLGTTVEECIGEKIAADAGRDATSPAPADQPDLLDVLEMHCGHGRDYDDCPHDCEPSRPAVQPEPPRCDCGHRTDRHPGGRCQFCSCRPVPTGQEAENG